MRQQEHALRYLEAVIRYVTSAGQRISAEDVRAAIEAVAPEGDAMVQKVSETGQVRCRREIDDTRFY